MVHHAPYSAHSIRNISAFVLHIPFIYGESRYPVAECLSTEMGHLSKDNAHYMFHTLSPHIQGLDTPPDPHP